MEFDAYFRFILALAFVVGLIGLCAWVFRRLGMTPRIGQRAANKRLSIVELSPLDGKRRLVLVRRDDIEHLVLLGPERDLVIETGIAARNLQQIADARQSVHKLPK